MWALQRAACIGCVLMSSFVQAQSSLPTGTWRIADAPAELRYPISRADLVVVSMHDALLRELNNALEQGGPAFAIQSCHIDVVECHPAHRSAGGSRRRSNQRPPAQSDQCSSAVGRAPG